MVAALLPWLLSTRQGTEVVAKLLTACLPGRVEIEMLDLSWTTPAELRGLRIYETHHRISRPLLHIGHAVATAPPLVFVYHFLLSLRLTPAPHPTPVPTIRITGLTVDGTFCLTHHQPRILTFLRLTGLLSVLSTLISPPPPSSDSTTAPQPAAHSAGPAATPNSNIPAATPNGTNIPDPSPLTSPSSLTPEHTTVSPSLPSSSHSTSPNSPRSSDPSDPPCDTATPQALLVSPASCMPPSPFLPDTAAPAVSGTLQPASARTLPRSGAFRESKDGTSLPPVPPTLVLPEPPYSGTRAPLTASNSRMRRSNASRHHDFDASLPPVPSDTDSLLNPNASFRSLPSSTLDPAGPPLCCRSPSSPLPQPVAPAMPSSTPEMAPLVPHASEPLPGDAPHGRRWYRKLLRRRRKGHANGNNDFPRISAFKISTLGTPPRPLTSSSSVPVEPSLPLGTAAGPTDTSMYRWWGMRLSSAATCNVALRADVWLPCCRIEVVDSVLQVPVDVMDVAGSTIYLQAAVGLQALQDAAPSLGATPSTGLDVRWASTPPPPTHHPNKAEASAAAGAATEATPSTTAGGATPLARTGSAHGWWMPPFVAQMHAEFLQCQACGWVAPRLLQLLLHKPIACDISLHPRLGRYALDFFNPDDEGGVDIADTTLRTAFSPAGMLLPCPAGGTLEVVPACLELERGLAFVQLLEQLVVRGLVEHLADAKTVTVWLAPRPIRLVAWERLVVPRQDVYIRAGLVELHLAMWGKLDLLTRSLDIRLALVAAGLARRSPLYRDMLSFSGICRAHDSVPDISSRHCPLMAEDVAAVMAEWGAPVARGAGMVMAYGSRRTTGTSDEDGLGSVVSSDEEGGRSSIGGHRGGKGRGKQEKKAVTFLWKRRVQGRPEEISLHLTQLGTFLTAYFAASALRGAMVGVGRSIANVLPLGGMQPHSR